MASDSKPTWHSARPSHLRAPATTSSSRGRSPFPVDAPPAEDTHDTDDEQPPLKIQAEPTRSPLFQDSAAASRDQAAQDDSIDPLEPIARRVSWHSASTFGPSVTTIHPTPGPRPTDRRLSSMDHTHTHAPESSGDETTAIISRERGRGRRYNTTTTNTTTTTTAAASSSSTAQPNPRSKRKPKPNGDAPATSTPAAATVAAAAPPSRWRALVDRYGSVELENKGSVARDHLALERTFLAWLRTSLSFASIGIAVTQLFRLNTSLPGQGAPRDGQSGGAASALFGATDAADAGAPRALHHVGRPLGATFLGIGILTLCIGFHRYFEAQHYVMLGKFPASRGSIVLITAVAGALIVASLAVILAVAPAGSLN